MKHLASNLISEISKSVPPLSSNFHKGQAGRIGIIGGCALYTGAPYYAGISTLKLGGDLAYVICGKSASIIKAYSPELIVLPILPEEGEKGDIVKTMKDNGIVERMHSFVIGPGLGRDETMMNSVVEMLTEIKKQKKIVVCDGDFLYLISKYPEVIKGYKNAILTPNVTEYSRLLASILSMEENEILDEGKKLDILCTKLGNVTIVRKGKEDWISNGTGSIYVCDSEGSNRRCGGQGDVLAGAIGLFAHWGLWMNKESSSLLVSCLGACHVAKTAAKIAFIQHGRSTTTPDIIGKLGESISSLSDDKINV